VRKKIILVNDTAKSEQNPGCETTVGELKKLLQTAQIFSLPLGFAYGLYKRSAKQYIPNLVRIGRVLLHNPHFLTAGLVVVNGEGTIHHNHKGGNVLLLIIFLARLFDKKVLLVNCSLEGLSPGNLLLLRFADQLAVREQMSYQYLKSVGFDPLLIPDCAFLAEADPSSNGRVAQTVIGERVCIFTPGVIYEHRQDNADYLRSQIEVIRQQGYQPYYLQVQLSEEKDCQVWERLGGRVIRRHQYRASDIFSLLAQAELVISGRYHILIFTLMVKRPFVKLPTNTWKIDGLLNYLDQRYSTDFSNHALTGCPSGFAADYRLFDLSNLQGHIKSAYAGLLSHFQ